MQKFKSLPPNVKAICFAITAIFALSIVMSIPTIVTKISTKMDSRASTHLDKHSNITVKIGTANPESYGVPKATPVEIGSNNLINRGMSFEKSLQVSKVLSAYYQHKNITEHSDIKIISIGKDVDSDWNGNTSTGTYNTTIQLDQKGALIPLQIVDVNDPLKPYFSIKLKIDGDYQTIYETNDDISQFVQ